MPRDEGYLLDILNEARFVQSFVQGIDLEMFRWDALRQRAVVRSIEIIGEAARRVSAEFQEQHPEIPWPAIIGMRNRLIHEYDTIDLGIVWEVAQEDIPELIALVEPLVPPSDSVDGQDSETID
jgi:uncharacterized protein with HEPN domain